MTVRFHKTTLSNGVRVVSEHHPQSRSLALGLWVTTGTRDEPEANDGITHFLEHLVFKGTKTRSAYEIVRSLEQIGGDINAFTTRETTCFHATVLSHDWKIALEVLSDLVTNMRLKKRDFEIERSVVLQEIDSSKDEHEDLCYDIFLSQFLRSHPLGKPILGTETSIKNIKIRDVQKYYRERYTGQNLIVSAAGNVQHDQLVKEVNRLLGKTPRRKPAPVQRKPQARPFVSAVDKAAEQQHLLLGLPATSFRDPQRFEAFLANNLLGGGMTSLLYQAIREKRGLAYSVYSSLHSFVDFGMINIAASAHPTRMQDVIKTVYKTLDRVRIRGIRESELKLFRRQLEGNLLLGAEDCDNRMHSLAVNEMIFEEYRPVEQIIQEVNKVSVKSLKKYLEEFLDPAQMGVLFLGSQANKTSDWFLKQPFARALRESFKAVKQ